MAQVDAVRARIPCFEVLEEVSATP
jgi:hypothetical protein